MNNWGGNKIGVKGQGIADIMQKEKGIYVKYSQESLLAQDDYYN